MYITSSIAVNTCFGHVSFDDAPRVADALSDLIDRTPTGAIARRLYLRSFGAKANAGRYLGRAWKRLETLAEAMDARRGGPMSHQFSEAIKGATLLIGADLVAAALVDQSEETGGKVISMLAIAFPELDLLDHYRDFEAKVVGSRQDADAIIAMTGKAFEQEFPRLASWYERTVTNPFATVSHSAPLLEDAAFARHQLLAAVRGEELLAFTDTVSARAKHAGLLAGAIGARIANRKIAPHRAPVAA